MPRSGRQVVELEKAAAKVEPRMERATLKAFDRVRVNLDINALANKIAAGDLRGAMRIIPAVDDLEATVEPLRRISEDAFKRGVRLGMEEIKRL